MDRIFILFSLWKLKVVFAACDLADPFCFQKIILYIWNTLIVLSQHLTVLFYPVCLTCVCICGSRAVAAVAGAVGARALPAPRTPLLWTSGTPSYTRYEWRRMTVSFLYAPHIFKKKNYSKFKYGTTVFSNADYRKKNKCDGRRGSREERIKTKCSWQFFQKIMSSPYLVLYHCIFITSGYMNSNVMTQFWTVPVQHTKIGVPT